jgi:RHS repeat-associated protein
VLWGLANHQGSITDLLDFDAGTSATTVVEHLVFDSFGNIVSDSNTNVAWHHGYTGREWDEDAGLYYYRARWFDPAPGCFLQAKIVHKNEVIAELMEANVQAKKELGEL